MAMNITRLTTHWDAAEAATAIEFLDRLRDALWETYGEHIATMHRHSHPQHSADARQCQLAFDDDIPF